MKSVALITEQAGWMCTSTENSCESSAVNQIIQSGQHQSLILKQWKSAHLSRLNNFHKWLHENGRNAKKKKKNLAWIDKLCNMPQILERFTIILIKIINLATEGALSMFLIPNCHIFIHSCLLEYLISTERKEKAMLCFQFLCHWKESFSQITAYHKDCIC